MLACRRSGRPLSPLARFEASLQVLHSPLIARRALRQPPAGCKAPQVLAACPRPTCAYASSSALLCFLSIPSTQIGCSGQPAQPEGRQPLGHASHCSGEERTRCKWTTEMLDLSEVRECELPRGPQDKSTGRPASRAAARAGLLLLLMGCCS